MKALRRRLARALAKAGSTDISFLEFKDTNATPDDQLIQHSWLRNRTPYHTKDYPLLWDENYNRKEAYNEFLTGLQLK